MISKGFGFVAFFASVKASSVCKFNYGENICKFMPQLIIPHQARPRGCTITVYGPQFSPFSDSVTTENFSQTFPLGDHCALTWNINVPTSSLSSSSAAAAAAAASSQSMTDDFPRQIYSPTTHFAH